MHKPVRSSLRSIVAVNVNLLTAAACAFVAWNAWPESPEWWGLGLLSILLWIGAVIGVGKALAGIACIYAREKTIADYMAQGGKQKSSRLVTESELSARGMLDD